MAKVPINRLQAGYRSSQSLNTNLETIETAFDNTLSRDGTSPNQMEAQLDMNNNRIINLPAPVGNADAVRKVDIAALDTIVDTAAGILVDAEAAATAAIAAQVAAELAETNAETAEVAAEAAQVAAEVAAAEAAASNADRADRTLSNLSSATTATANLQLLQSGASAVALSLQTVVRQIGATPEQFGAVGDGVADDTAELQAMFTAHKAVTLKRGATYKVSAALTFQPGTFIDGNGATIQQVTDQTPILDGRGTANLTVVDLNAVGKRSDYIESSSTLALFAQTDGGSDNWRIFRSTFTNFSGGVIIHSASVNEFYFCHNRIYGPGLVADGGPLVVGSTRNCFGVVAGGTNIIVCHNYVTKTAQGLFVRLDTDGFMFDSNIIENIEVEHGIYGDTGLRNGSISRNVIKNPYLDGLKVQQSNAGAAAYNVTIQGNTIYSPGGNGIGVPSASNPATVFADGFAVVDNAIYQAAGYGIVVRGLRHSRVGGNVIVEAGSQALIHRDCDNVLFDNNLIVKSYLTGVFDESGNVDCLYENNRLYQPGTIGGAGGDPMGFVINSGVRSQFRNNTVVGDVAKMRYAFIIYGGTDLIFEGNRGTNANEFGLRLIGGNIKRFAGNSFEATSGPTLGLPTSLVSGNWSHSEFTGDAAPSSGTYSAGAFVRNVDPAAAEPFGWVCTVSGAPGTWVPVGVLGQVQGVSVSALTATATSGSLPTPDGSITIANAATPTVNELLEFCVELKNRHDALTTSLRDAKVIA